MLEKLFLAVTITLSLNFFFQVRMPHQANSGASYKQHTDTSATVLVKRPER